MTILLAANSLFAQTGDALVNQWLRNESPVFEPWDFGGQIRARFEDKEDFATPGKGSVDFQDHGGNDENAYFLFREKFHIGYKNDWLGAYIEARDSRSWRDERAPSPDVDPFDLQQAYFLFGNDGKFPITLKIGRQELSYGDERLIGASDWGNISRTFDAVKLRYQNQNFWIDAFVSRVVLPNPHDFDEANDYDFFSGIYVSTQKLIRKNETQIYLLSRNVSVDSPNAIGAGLPAFMTGASARDIYTLGARVKSLPDEFGPWDYDTEIAGQLGNFKSKNGARLDHEAFAAHAAGGYTWKNIFGKPRVGLEYNYASGDSDPNDGRHETFDNLFPTNHRLYGYMDFVSWQNIHNARLTSSFKPLNELMFTADYHAFWLADNRDAFYQVNGSPRSTGGYGIRPGAGNYLGSELDFTGTYNVSRNVSLQAGCGHFFVGNYVENSLAESGGAKNANWIFTQLVMNF